MQNVLDVSFILDSLNDKKQREAVRRAVANSAVWRAAVR